MDLFDFCLMFIGVLFFTLIFIINFLLLRKLFAKEKRG